MKASGGTRSNCEKEFVLSAIDNGLRLDGRKNYDFRRLKISFGESFGHCDVCLGSTRCLAQVSCEVVTPNQNRPTEGQLFLNLELSPMASPAFESGRPSNYATEMNRFIERCLRESRPIDLESLCILAGEKVWCLRVDIQVLDDSGNIMDCACIAAISALAHFRRPDVSVHGKEVTVHSLDEKEPIPLNVHHMPICVTFGFIELRDKSIIDPTDLEESIIDGHMIMAMNSHSEICCAKMAGVSVNVDQIMMCCNVAIARVNEITEIIKKSLENDYKKRFPPKDKSRMKPIGDDIEEMMITKTIAQPTNIDITESVRESKEISKSVRVETPETSEVTLKAADIGNIGNGESSVWVISDDDDDMKDDITDHVEIRRPTKEKRQPKGKDYIVLDDDMSSEEEETMQLTSEDFGFSNSKPSKIDEENVDPTTIKNKTSTKTVQKEKSSNISSSEKNFNTSEQSQKKKNKKKKKKT